MVLQIAKLKEELKSQTEKSSLSERITPSTVSLHNTDVCQFNIDTLLTDISVAYGRRRELRDALLDLEASKLNCKHFIITKQKLLENMNTETQDTSGAKVSQVDNSSNLILPI